MKHIVRRSALWAGASFGVLAVPGFAQPAEEQSAAVNQRAGASTPAPQTVVATSVAITETPATTKPPLDLMADTWVASDALNRKIAQGGSAGVPAPRQNKTVILFYYIWHGFHSPIGPNDISKLLAANPEKPQYGPNGSFHWWGEPEAGYYRAEDPWVIRRNLSMIADAGVDAIFFDVTNAFTYPNTVKAVCEEARKMRLAGDKTPQIGFVTHAHAAVTQQKLYDEFYSKNLYEELWFKWQGKPLILGEVGAKFDDGREQSETVKNFFTWRYSWAWDSGEGKWPWLEKSPQKPNPAPGQPGSNEEIPVSTAEHPTGFLGKSYSNGAQPPLNDVGLTSVTNQGLYFAQQWDGALKLDPQAVFVTQWNEWVAQRFTVEGESGSPFLGKPTKKGDSFFVDVYNAEFNRDIEPMKGGWNDNYYFQLVSNIRKYKGARPVPTASKAQTIKIDGQFGEWKGVSPEYRDTALDTLHRNFAGYAGDLHYVNASGRNDITRSKVARDAKNVYFYVQTRENITPWNGGQWMQLFIDADQNPKTGWNGYDYAVNTRVLSGKETTVARFDGKGWVAVGRAAYSDKGRDLEIQVPRALLGQKTGTKFDFHWTDNAAPNNLSDWFVSGDSAPNRRFNYRFNG